VEELSPAYFFEFAMDYEEHIKQWLLKEKEFSNPERVCIV
jgi:hypothetical protein